MTIDFQPLVPVTAADATEDDWLEARASRVTASEVHDIAVGGRATWQRILNDKLNGSLFKGTASTARGKVREAYLLDYAREHVIPAAQPNKRLFVHPVNDRIGATPDGLAIFEPEHDHPALVVGVEAKSHDAGHDTSEVPADHYDQMQIGMYVTGSIRWLYIVEVMGDDGEPTLDDPIIRWIDRDERRIAFLVREALAFLAWWDSGAPATDDLPAELDDALAAWADARARKKDAEADEKAAEAVVRKHIATTTGAEDDGLKLAGRAAQFVYSVTDKDVLDPEAWKSAEPESFGDWTALQDRIEDGAKAAARLYHKTARSTRLSITPTKETA